jgi:TPR repeat protein
MESVSSCANSLLPGSVELQAAHKARIEERYTDALEYYQQSAELDNPRAVWELSLLYDEEIWGLWDPLSEKAEEFLLKAVKLGFEPAMMEHAEENHQQDLTKSKYYNKLIASKDPYVMARLFYLNMMTTGSCTPIKCQTSIKLYQDAIDAGYFECYSQIYIMAGICLSIEDRSEWLLKGATNGHHYLQWELGCQFNARSKQTEYQFSTSDHAALHWYSKAIKQSDTAAMKAAQKIYFDKHSQCYDCLKGADTVILMSTLAAERHLKAFPNNEVNQHSMAMFKVLFKRLRILAYSHNLSDDDCKEMWLYGRLLTTFPIIIETLKFKGYTTGRISASRCVTVYIECTEKARQTSLTFLLCWRQSPELWNLNRDIAVMIAREVYRSRCDPKIWIPSMVCQ